MLISLAIRDVVLIEALDLTFAPGLGVLTGETGAGKSILLDALGLALGARGDAGLVRHGATQAVVTATFATPADDGPVAAALRENGLDLDPGEPLIVRRIVKGRRWQPRVHQRSVGVGGVAARSCDASCRNSRPA